MIIRKSTAISLSISSIFVVTLFSFNPSLLNIRRTLFVSSNPLKSMAAIETNGNAEIIDPLYPGTAVHRMMAIRDRVKSLSADQLSAGSFTCY